MFSPQRRGSVCNLGQYTEDGRKARILYPKNPDVSILPLSFVCMDSKKYDVHCVISGLHVFGSDWTLHRLQGAA